jgi:hypothetical protein
VEEEEETGEGAEMEVKVMAEEPVMEVAVGQAAVLETGSASK